MTTPDLPNKKSRWTIAVIALAILFVASLILTVTARFRQLERREQMIADLMAQTAKYKPSNPYQPDISISVAQAETRLWGFLPRPITYLTFLYWNQPLPNSDLNDLLQGNLLEYLSLARNDLSRESLELIAGHPKLRVLSVADAALNFHWTELLHLKPVSSLGIGRVTWPADSDARFPADLSHLNHFGMSKMTVRPDDLEFLLTPTADIKSLSLYGCDIPPEAIDILSRLTRLRTLSLYHSRFDAAAISKLRTLTNLTQLSLAGTDVTDDDVAFLTEMDSLEYVYLAGCPRITIKIRNALDRAPNLKRLQFVTFGPVSSDPSAARNVPNIPDIDRRTDEPAYTY